MFEIIRSSTFSRWLNDLRDNQARMRVLARHYGPGYRLYCRQYGMQVVVMLCGGDKSSQPLDIERAKTIAKDWKE